MKEIFIWYSVCGGVSFLCVAYCLLSDLRFGRDVIVEDLLMLALSLFLWPIIFFICVGVVFEKIRYTTLIKGKDVK